MLKGQDAEQLREWAAQQRFDYQEEFDRNELQVDGLLQTTENWYRGANLIRGTARNAEFQLFDMQQMTISHDEDGHRHTSYPERTAILFPKPHHIQESEVRISSRGKVMQLLGVDMGNLKFNLEGGFPEDQQAVGNFNRDYFVISNEVSVVEGESAPAPEWLSFDLLRKLTEGPGWNIEIGTSQIAMYRSQNVIGVDQRSESLEELHDLYELLDSPPRSTFRLTMTRSSTSIFKALVEPMIWVMAGGVAGMVATMAIYGSLFVFAKDLPRWALLTFPFVGMALVVGGVLFAMKLKRLFSGSEKDREAKDRSTASRRR